MNVQLFQEDGLWVALLPTQYGIVELLCGSNEEPSFPDLVIAEQFIQDPGHLEAIRRNCLSLSFLWRPIRLAVNNDGRLGVQFRNRLTGKQVGMFFADEHSQFQKNRKDVELTEEDRKRFRHILST